MAELPRYKKRIQALPEDRKIYVYLGHGSDVCDPTTHRVIERRVPPGCIFVTITLCGALAVREPNVDNILRRNNPRETEILKKPYENKAELARLFDVSVDRIKIKGPGETYVVNRFQPGSIWHEADIKGMAISGVCEKTKLEELRGAPWAMNPYRTTPLGLRIGDALPISFTKEQFASYYGASVYPTQEEVTRVLNTEPPGVISSDMFNRVVSKIEESLGVFPDSEEDGPDAYLTNRHIMELFPGVHYMYTCRYIQEEACKVSYERRRAQSEANEAAREANLAREND
jgi:hypothetical protein